MDQETALLVAFAKLEGKVDLTLTELGALKAADSDHEQRLRSIEAQPIPDPSTEQRLRTLEDRRTISPRQLWGGLVGVTTVLASVAGVVAVIALIKP